MHRAAAADADQPDKPRAAQLNGSTAPNSHPPTREAESSRPVSLEPRITVQAGNRRLALSNLDRSKPMLTGGCGLSTMRESRCSCCRGVDVGQPWS